MAGPIANRWEIGHEIGDDFSFLQFKAIKRDFAEDSLDADLKTWHLQYQGTDVHEEEFNFNFRLASVPKGKEVELEISLAILLGCDNTWRNFTWLVTSLRQSKQVSLTCRRSAINNWVNWQKFIVQINHVKRSTASRKHPKSVPIGPEKIQLQDGCDVDPSTLPASTSATPKHKNINEPSVSTATRLQSLLIKRKTIESRNRPVDPPTTAAHTPRVSSRLAKLTRKIHTSLKPPTVWRRTAEIKNPLVVDPLTQKAKMTPRNLVQRRSNRKVDTSKNVNRPKPLSRVTGQTARVVPRPILPRPTVKEPLFLYGTIPTASLNPMQHEPDPPSTSTPASVSPTTVTTPVTMPKCKTDGKSGTSKTTVMISADTSMSTAIQAKVLQRRISPTLLVQRRTKRLDSKFKSSTWGNRKTTKVVAKPKYTNAQANSLTVPISPVQIPSGNPQLATAKPNVKSSSNQEIHVESQPPTDSDYAHRSIYNETPVQCLSNMVDNITKVAPNTSSFSSAATAANVGNRKNGIYQVVRILRNAESRPIFTVTRMDDGQPTNTSTSIVTKPSVKESKPKTIPVASVQITKNTRSPLAITNLNISESQVQRGNLQSTSIPAVTKQIFPHSQVQFQKAFETQLGQKTPSSTPAVDINVDSAAAAVAESSAMTNFFPHGYYGTTNNAETQTSKMNEKTILIDICVDDGPKPTICPIGVQSQPTSSQEPNLNGSDFSSSENQHVQSAEDRVALISRRNTTDCDRIPPGTSQSAAKRQKMSEGPTAVVNHIDAESAASVAGGQAISIAKVTLNQAGKDNQMDGGVESNLPPVFPGWTTDYPDFILISADNLAFPVCRGVLSRKSAVFKADFSTDAAKKDGRVKTAFSGDVMVELLSFLDGKSFTANLASVAVELYRAAEYYQLAMDKNLVEEELIKLLSLANFPSTVRLAAKQLKSDRLMKEISEFAKQMGLMEELLKLVLDW